MSNEPDVLRESALGPNPVRDAVADGGQSVTPGSLVGTGFILSMGLWSVLVASVAAGVVWVRMNAVLQQELALRPPIVVVDSYSWIQSAGEGLTLDERYVDGARSLRDAIKKLKTKDVLVIEKSATKSVPDALYLQPPAPTKRDAGQ